MQKELGRYLFSVFGESLKLPARRNRAEYDSLNFLLTFSKVYIYGGECASSSRAYDDLWSYRPDLAVWEKHEIVSRGGIRPDDRPGKLIGAKFVAVRTGLYLFGGCIFDSTECSMWFLNTETFQFYKIQTFGSDQPSNLLHASLIWHNHNQEDYLYLFGGFKHLLGPQDSFYRLQVI